VIHRTQAGNNGERRKDECGGDGHPPDCAPEASVHHKPPTTLLTGALSRSPFARLSIAFQVPVLRIAQFGRRAQAD